MLRHLLTGVIDISETKIRFSLCQGQHKIKICRKVYVIKSIEPRVTVQSFELVKNDKNFEISKMLKLCC
jgi:hypothetical protein